MSNRLGIAQANRLRTYEMLKNQPESVLRRVLGPDYKSEMANLTRRMERIPDPQPHADGLPFTCADDDDGEVVNPLICQRLFDILKEHWKTGDLLPSNAVIAAEVGQAAPTIANQMQRLRRCGVIEVRFVQQEGIARRRIVGMVPARVRVEGALSPHDERLQTLLYRVKAKEEPLPSLTQMAQRAKVPYSVVKNALRKWERAGKLALRREDGKRWIERLGFDQ